MGLVEGEAGDEAAKEEFVQKTISWRQVEEADWRAPMMHMICRHGAEDFILPR